MKIIFIIYKGQIFNCDLNEKIESNEINCKSIKISSRNKPILINDFMQLGSSLSSSNNGKFTVCAAGTLNSNFKDHYPNGQCWFGNYSSSLVDNLSSDLNNEVNLNNLLNLNPLNDTRRQIYENTYFFSHGMFGFSSKISKVCL